MRAPSWKNLLLLAIGILLAAALLEGGARLIRYFRGTQAPIAIVPKDGAQQQPVTYGPNEGDINSIHLPDQWVWWRVKPNLENYHVDVLWDRAHSFTLSTDAQGFRRTGEIHADAPLQVLVVGDSTAMGVGVNDTDTWPAMLEALLVEKTGKTVEVRNAGVPGFSTFQAVRMAEKYAMTPKPNVVIICAGFNDTGLTPPGELPDLKRAAKNEAEQAAGGSGSQFLKLFADAVAGPPPAEQIPRLPEADYRETIAHAESYFAGLGIPLVWVRWPTQEEFEGRTPSGGYPQVLLEHCAQPGTRCVDLMPVFKASPQPPYYDFVHATADGNREAAKAVAKVVDESIRK